MKSVWSSYGRDCLIVRLYSFGKSWSLSWVVCFVGVMVVIYQFFKDLFDEFELFYLCIRQRKVHLSFSVQFFSKAKFWDWIQLFVYICFKYKWILTNSFDLPAVHPCLSIHLPRPSASHSKSLPLPLFGAPSLYSIQIKHTQTRSQKSNGYLIVFLGTPFD